MTLDEAQVSEIERALTELGQRVSASLVMLASKSGHFVASWGDQRRADTASLGSLAAGYLAAGDAIAHSIGEYDGNQVALREGVQSSLILSEAGCELVLLVVVPWQEPLGWARLGVRETAQELAGIVDSRWDRKGLPGDLASPDVSRLLDQLWEGL